MLSLVTKSLALPHKIHPAVKCDRMYLYLKCQGLKDLGRSNMKSPDIDQPVTKESETNQTKNGFLALVSKMTFDEKLPIRFMYKTVPEHLNDTGWRMYTGYEDQEYLENELANMVPVPVEKMCRIDPSLTDLVSYNAGTVWERTPESDGWERVNDYKIPTHSVDVDITNDIDRFNYEYETDD